MKTQTPGITPTPTPAKSVFEGLPNALAREIQDEVKYLVCADGVAFVQSKLDEHVRNETASLVSRVTELEKALRELQASSLKISKLLPLWLFAESAECKESWNALCTDIGRAESVLEAKRAMEGK